MNQQQTMQGQPCQPKIEAVCRGDGREVGLVLGSELQSKISRAESEVLQLEVFRSTQPWWLPASFHQYMASWRARCLLEPNIREWFPEMAQRIDGMSEGARTSVDFLYLFHALESAATAPYHMDPAIAACTAVAARGGRTPKRELVVGHNFDLVDTAGSLLTLRESSKKGGLRFLGFSLAPMVGVIDGVNEAGLGITYNYAPTTDLCPGGPPVSFSVDETLASCTSVEQAAARLIASPRGGGALLMLADASGDIAALELSARHAELRRPADSDVLWHSNAYHSSAMQQYEISRDAIYTTAAPRALRGRAVFQSAMTRDRRMRELLDSVGTLNEEGLERILSDHDVSQSPSSDTICMHGDYWSTMASVQIFPGERRLRVSYGPACTASYQSFVL